MPSLVNTLRRCHSTVRGLRKSCAPISGFDRPSRASRAICRSCGGQLVARLGGPPAHPLARGQQLAPGTLGERLHADRHEQLVGRAQLCARVDAAILAAQPLPVEEMRACEVGPEPRAPQAVDGLAVQALGGLALAQQRARPGVEAERPVGVAGLRVLAESRESALRELGVPGPRGGLDQLAQRPRGDVELRRVLARLHGRRERLLVAAEAVHEHGRSPSARTGRRSPGRRRWLP